MLLQSENRGRGIPANARMSGNREKMNSAPDSAPGHSEEGECRSEEKEQKHKRGHEVKVYLNGDEFRHLEELKRISGLAFSALIRKMIAGTEIQERTNRDYRTLTRSVERIGADIDQIAHMANITRNVETNHVKQLREEFRMLQKEIEVWKKQWL